MSEEIYHFEILVRHGALRGQFHIEDFVEAYKAMNPSLHRYCREPDVVDVEALLYALKRLPDGIHQVREILVQSDIPDKLPSMEGVEEVIVSTRRRSTYMLGPDRLVIVAREGVTELLDLVTLLSAFTVEARKIAALLRGTTLLDDVRAGHSETGVENRLLVRLAFELGTTDDQLMALREHWGEPTLERILAVVDRPTNIDVRLHRDYSLQAAQNRSISWARRLAQEIERSMPGQRDIHILSSNTHSTINLLSPFPRLHREGVLAWASANDSAQMSVVSSDNLLYYALRGYLEAQPQLFQARKDLQIQHGIMEVTDLDRVGVTAQLIDLGQIDYALVDARLQLPDQEPSQRPILLNFDYAFGDQAGVVVEQLFRALGSRIRSFSIMGKAGTLVGQRGGLMLPSYILREGTRDVYDIPGGNFLTSADFASLEVGEVHAGGPMLTVLGTILQNDELLRTYRDEWKVLGLEMEGVPYLRSLHQALKLGILRSDLKVGIGYYASDSPLVPGQSLARSLAAQGVNATYALNLVILRKLLGP